MLPGRDYQFEIPDEWWNAAEMQGFTPKRTGFRWQPHDERRIELTPITAIETPKRRPDFGFPIFRDRMISILRGIRDDQPLPAVGVTPLHDTTGPFMY